MDPISVGSNTAALLSLAISIDGALYKTWNAESRPTIERLRQQINRLRASLLFLERESLKTKAAVPLSPLPNIFRCLKDVLVSLSSKVLSDREEPLGSDVDALSMTWKLFDHDKEVFALPFTKAEGEETLSKLQVQIERLRKVISTLFTSNGANQTIVNLPGALPPSGLWRDRADYNTTHANAQDRRVEGSGAWLLSGSSEFTGWLKQDRIDAGRQSNLLYCVGKPGSGKTILASAVIEELKSLQRDSNSHVGLAYFYFSYKHPNAIYTIVLALLEQLYLRSPTLATEVLQMEEMEDPKTSARQLPLSRLIAVLMSVAARFNAVYMVLDALDECSDDNKADLINLIKSIASSQCRLFVTARPSHGLNVFDRCPRIHVSPTREDMRLFACKRLEEHSGAYTESEKRQIVESVVEKGGEHGMFLLVELQLNAIMATYVRGVPNNFNLEDNLKKLTSDISTVYDEQLRRISAQEPLEVELAGLVLSWLYYNTGSMPARQLLEVLQFSFAQRDLLAPLINLRLVTKVCLDLVRYSESDGMVSFLHFSLYEYMEEVDRQRTRSSESYIPAWPLPNHFLGRVCMQYLFSIAVSVPSGSYHALEKKLEAHPFYEWASSHWNRLYSASEPDAVGYLQKLLHNDLAVQAIVEVVFQHENRYWSCREDQRFPALHFLVYFGIPLVGLLTNQKLINHLDFLRRTPLHIAAIRNGGEAVTELSHFYRKQGIELDGMVELKDKLGKTLWHYVAWGNCVSVARELAAQLGRIEVSSLTAKDIAGMTPLWYAASEGHFEIIEFLLRLGLPQLFDQSKEALKYASEGGHLEVVKMLLETGVEISHDHLIAAIDSGASDVVILFLEYGVNVDSGKTTSALHEAARSQKTPILSSLIWNGADLELMDSAAQTPLALAAKQNSVDVVKLLLDAGADPSVQIQREKVALFWLTTAQLTFFEAHLMHSLV